MLITETFQDVPTKADGNGNIRKPKKTILLPPAYTLSSFLFFFCFLLKLYKLSCICTTFKGRGEENMRGNLLFFIIIIIIIINNVASSSKK